MTNQEAHDLLVEYNAWRRGSETEMLKPGEIGEAIDAGIKALSTLNSLLAHRGPIEAVVATLEHKRATVQGLGGSVAKLKHLLRSM